MKQISTKNKIAGIVSILIVIVGLIVVVVSGFNVERRYRSYNEIKVYVGKEIDIKKIEEIVDEVFGNNKAIVQIVEVYNDTFQVTADLITEEQKDKIVEKVNSLYPVEVEESSEEANTEGESVETTENTENEQNVDGNVRINSEDVEITSASNIRVRDILKPYIIPFTVATVIILVYLGIRYRGLGIIKSIFEPVGILIATQILLFSILAIIRFPMGRFTPTMMLIVYIVSILYISNKVKNDK